MLNENEEKKYTVIEEVENGFKTRKEAKYELNLSLKQIDRLRVVYRNEGKNGFIHKGRGRKSKKKIDRRIIEELEDLYLTEYYDYNFEHFYEQIVEKYNVSYSVILSEFKKDDIISPLAHKNTIKVYTENMNKAIKNDEKNISQEKINLFNTRMLEAEKAHTRKSSNHYSFGQEVQMDACEKEWFGGVVSHLHLAVDKGTKKVLFGWFEYEEITRGYFVVLYHIIINYGIPARIKTDNRNSFSNQKNKVDTTQFGIICKTLGIELITTSVAVAKANVERENETFKNRLISELRHERIFDIDRANEYLNNVFIPEMNKLFSYEIDYKTSKMRTNNYTEEELNLLIAEKCTRIIDNASSIKYNNKYYVPINPKTGEVTPFMKKTECTFIITYNAEYWCKIEGNYYMMLEVENRDLVMKKEKDNKKSIEKKKYIPPANHPWRKHMM